MAVKIQARRGTAAEWISSNPTLSVGEFGFETDTLKLKIGNGTTVWTSLAYVGVTASELEAAVAAAVSGVIDLAPETLDTLSELAAAIGDDPDFFNTVATNLSNHEADTTDVHGIADTSELETKTGAQDKADAAQSAAESFAIDAINSLDTDDIHEGSSNKYFTDQRAIDATTDQYEPLGSVSQSESESREYTDSAIEDHNALTNDVHGILSTEALADKPYVDEKIFDLDVLLDGHTLDKSTHGVTGEIVGTTDFQTISNKTLSSDLLMDGNQISGLGSPTQATHATTKAYVDSVAEGLHVHASVTAATAEEVDLATGGLLEIDGVQLVSGDRVLVKDQEAQAENGIYVAGAGAWSRAEDYDTATEIQSGDFVFVTTGEDYGNSGWIQKNPVAVLNTDPIEWVQFSGAGTYLAGNGLELTGNVFSIDTEVTATKLYAEEAAETAAGLAIDHANEIMVGHNSSTSVHGINDTAELATFTDVADAIGQHNSTTVNIHGIDDADKLIDEAKLGFALDEFETQLNTEIDTKLEEKAPLNSPTFTGEVELPLETFVARSGEEDPNFNISEELEKIDLKLDTSEAEDIYAPIESPTFVGNVVLPISTTIGEIDAGELAVLDGLTVSTEELNYVDGVTSSIQDQIDTKAPTNSPAFTGTVSGITKSMVGLSNVDNTSDIDKPVSTATQVLINQKAPLNNPTFTGTVTGVTKAHVGLGNVDNTSDANKPISTATQTALNAKASNADLAAHEADTTNIHGIADTAELETKTGAQSKATTAKSEAIAHTDAALGALNTTSVPEGTNQYFTTERAQDAVGNFLGSGLIYDDPSGAISVDLATSSGLKTDNSGKLEIDDAITTTNSGSQTLTNKTIDSEDNDITVVVADISDLTATAEELNVLEGITANTTELNFVEGVTSSIQSQIDGKASLAGATFTGTVNGITKAMVGLGNVDNTSDVNKPVSSATQTALNARLPLAGGTLTGPLTLAGAPTSALQAATK